jgi:hypothetical protein
VALLAEDTAFTRANIRVNLAIADKEWQAPAATPWKFSAETNSFGVLGT